MKNKYLLIALLLSGCGPATHITSAWEVPTTGPLNTNPVLVAGIMNDSVLCRKMEENFVTELQSLGYRAASSLAEYGPNAFDPANEEEPFKYMYNTRFKAVITIELLTKEITTFPQPSWLEKDFYWNNQPFVNQKEYPINNSAIQSRYIWKSNVYDVNGFSLLYSVSSISYEPSSNYKLAKEYGKVIIADLARKGVLKKQAILLKAF